MTPLTFSPQARALAPSAAGLPPDQQVAALAYAAYIDNPAAYVHDIVLRQGKLGALEPHQADAMMLVAREDRVAMKAANGVGKDTVSGWLIEWYLMTRPQAKVPVTSGVYRQVRSMLWSEISKWSSNSLSAPFLRALTTRLEVRGYNETWFAEGFTAREESQAEGYHAPHLLYVITEAKAVADKIWNAVFKACTGEGNKIFCQSVPGGEVGEFFRIFSKTRSTWKTFSFPAARRDPETKQWVPTTRLVSQTSIQEKLEKGGEDGPLFQAGVRAEFLRQTSDSLIPMSDVEAARAPERHAACQADTGPTETGVDVARFGEDESTVYTRRGRRIVGEAQTEKQDLMALTGLVVSEVVTHRSTVVRVDEIGLGAGVIDRLNELAQEAKQRIAAWRPGHPPLDAQTQIMAGLLVVSINVSKPSTDASRWLTLRDEIWDRFREKLQKGTPALPEDLELATQLTTPRYSWNSKGQKRVEAKEEMKKRGFGSPDRAEGIIFAYAEEVEAIQVFVTEAGAEPAAAPRTSAIPGLVVVGESGGVVLTDQHGEEVLVGEMDEALGGWVPLEG